MSGALIGKRPITITVGLVREIGANNAIVLQQVQWWSIESRKSEEGWVTMSLGQFGESTGLSRSALQRSLAWLREHGYVITRGGNGVELSYAITPSALALGGSGTGTNPDRSGTKVKRSPVQKRTGDGVGTTSMDKQDLEKQESAADGARAAGTALVASEPREQVNRATRAEIEPVTDHRANARVVVEAAWERRVADGKPKPVLTDTKRRGGSPFMALVGIVETLIENGHPAELVALALYDHDSAWSTGALLVTLGKLSAGKATDPRLAAAMHDKLVADELRRIRED